LSILAPFLITVEPIAALSIETFEPSSTLSSITTLPICGIFVKPPSLFGKYPNPSEPTTEPEWIITLFPIIFLSVIVTLGYSRIFSPIITFSKITVLWKIFALLPITQFLEITTLLPIATLLPSFAVG
jgi:hypothetical protein